MFEYLENGDVNRNMRTITRGIRTELQVFQDAHNRSFQQNQINIVALWDQYIG